MTPEELLVDILKKNQKIVVGQTLGTDGQGKCIVQGESGVVNAIAGGDLPAGNCAAFKADDGNWYAISATQKGTVSKRSIFKERRKPLAQSKANGSVIFLFKDSEVRGGSNITTFWVGGDRSTSEQIYEFEENFEDTTKEFIYGSIQKTGVELNNFVVNLVVKKVPNPTIPPTDLTEPITYFLYKIESIDDGSNLEVLTDESIVDGVYSTGSLSIYRETLTLPQYPSRAIPKLLQNDEATLNDRGFYEGIENSDYCFQYGYFGGFEIAKGTISEVRSGEWHNIEQENPADEFPPKAAVRPSDNLDSLPQFEPDDLKYQVKPYATLYDYSQIKYTYEAGDTPIDPPRYSCSGGRCIEYPNGAYGSLAECQADLPPPPFTGGQSVGIPYFVTVKAEYPNGAIWYSMGRNPRQNTSFPDSQKEPINGAIEGIRWTGFGRTTILYLTANGVESFFGEAITGDLFNNIYPTSVSIISIVRADGLPDTGGDPPADPACPVLPPVPADYNEGCSDIDANNYAELGYPTFPDRRTPETCAYNPFRIRSNKRIYKTIFASINPDIEVTPIAPAITPIEQNLVINNPIKKLVDNSSPEVLSVNTYSVPTASGIATSEQITVKYLPPDPTEIPPELAHLAVNSEFQETDFLAVSFDTQSCLVKKTSKYPSEISEIVADLNALNPPDPVTGKEVIDLNSVVTDGTATYPFSSFGLSDNFFDGDSKANGKSVFDPEFYSPNYAIASTLFIAAKRLDDEGNEDQNIVEGDTIEIVRTTIGETIAKEPLYGAFIGDKRGVIVDASAYYGE